MLVVMDKHATPANVEQVLAAVRQMGLTPHPMPGATRTAIGITGNIGAVDPRTAEWLTARGVRLLRAGAFKPRTSPYAFQGLGLEGLEILARVRERTGIGIVTELMDTEQASAVEQAADIIQI